MSESPFFVAPGEEELWRDVGAEDAEEVEAVEYIFGRVVVLPSSSIIALIPLCLYRS